MAPRLVQILDAYTKLYTETGKDQPLIVIARCDDQLTIPRKY
jgi:hypothetical protein